MKSCPACNTRYEDHVTYCTKDGTAVVLDASSHDSVRGGDILADRYRVLKKLGEGGMGEVFLAEHVHIEKRVALKLLRAEVLSNQEAVARFRQEARSASSIGHENIITIDDFGTLPDGRVYLTMEFLVGAPLNDMIAKEPLPLPRALDILIQSCVGLAAAHNKGIVHRDMKPDNIYVTSRDGRDVPKILDFGIAKVQGGDTSQALTQAGAIYGTPHYMAPEQALGGKIDHRADIYAMGVIVYEVFTGSVPFKGETFMGILTQHITMSPVPPSEMAQRNGRVCPLEVEQVILKAMRKEPNERFQSMNEMVQALTDVYRLLIGPRMTGAFAGAPISGFVPVPTQGMGPYATGQTPAYQGKPLSSVMPTVAMPVATPLGLSAVPPPVSGQQVAASGRRGKGIPALAVILGAAVLGGGGAAVLFLGRGGDPAPTGPSAAKDLAVVTTKPGGEAPRPEPVVVPVNEPVHEPVKAAGTEGTRPVAVRPPPGTPPRPEPPRPEPLPDPTPPEPPRVIEKKSVIVASAPPGAALYVDGKKLGEAPEAIEVVDGAPVRVTLKLDGYEDKTITVGADLGKVTGRLQRKASEEEDPELKPFEPEGGGDPKPAGGETPQ